MCQQVWLAVGGSVSGPKWRIAILIYSRKQNIFAFAMYMYYKMTGVVEIFLGKRQGHTSYLSNTMAVDDTGSKGVSGQSIDLVLPEYSDFNTRGVNCSWCMYRCKLC